ncbi:hypothetical protein [uncultured Flavonifractor sp.]|uniref:hypothetical protein n=1 Tax=uncultured Flavonifractor sp. TaxID=1193534 RepID=UPI0017498E30|nr:hypothetical protein [uncultured Flavonifractor sp.]
MGASEEDEEGKHDNTEANAREDGMKNSLALILGPDGGDQGIGKYKAKNNRHQ